MELCAGAPNRSITAGVPANRAEEIGTSGCIRVPTGNTFAGGRTLRPEPKSAFPGSARAPTREHRVGTAVNVQSTGTDRNVYPTFKLSPMDLRFDP